MTHQVQWRPGDGFLEYWVMSKGPPSPLYLLFNLAGAALVYGGALALGDRTHRAPWSWLVTLGKASLFVYVMHLILYKGFAWMGYRIAHEHHSWRLLVTWLPGVIVLIPMAAWYRRLKERHHDGMLKYL
jgi:peptidoglycan/LPS O-acetylase OafA/YrhL